MKRKSMTRSALVTSIISLLLCVSMLVGTTFAWFTDEVVTGMNTIAAGNLDIELWANGAPVDAGTKLFNDVTLWEPGVVTYEDIEIKNVGTLGLKYQLTMNFKDNNDLNGHKLSEVVKVAIVDKTKVDFTDRQAVLAAAQDAAKADKGLGNLANFYDVDELVPGDSKGMTIVVFWAPNANEIDNLYNANNGQKTSDGQPLSIEFGINLQATQLMLEEDSFGTDYDEMASILPKAAVNALPAQTINATWGIGGSVDSLEAPFVMQFQPNETLDEAVKNEYKYYNADFVVYADRDVPAESIALAGYYNEWCQYNNDNWVALTAPNDIKAGEQVRLVENMGGGAIKVSYKDLCQYGNDGTGFLCTAIDLTGENAGTTITVELRMYKTDSDPNSSSNTGSEVVPEESYLIGTYTYTFANKVATADELKAQLEKGNDVTLAADLELDADEAVKVAAGKDVTIDLAGHTITAVSEGTGANRNAFDVNGGTLTVKNGTVTTTHTGANMGWSNSTNVFNVTGGGVLNLENATIMNLGGSDMAFAVHLNNWGEVTLNAKNTTFKSNYVAIRVFNSGNDMNNVTLEGCRVEGASNALWVHNYTEADFGAANKVDVQKALLNFALTGNTYVGNPEKAGPIRLGMTDAIYGGEEILP